MCQDCGCQEGNERKYFAHQHSHNGHTHSHNNNHDHTHSHDHDHDHHHIHSVEVPVGRKVLEKNDQIAAENRKWLSEKGVVSINIISSPGSGKTLLLEKTLKKLQGEVNCAVIVGDQQTDNDARRLLGKGAKVHQIETYSSCHLNAEQVKEALPKVVDEETQLLFIENVGNLVCPAAFDLGENFKIAMLSTTEGEDKAIKYPVLFSDSKLVIVSKTDLIPYLDWDLAKCRKYIRQINPGVFIFEISSKTEEGLSAWTDYLKNLL